MPEVRAMEAFGHVQSFAMWIAELIQPGLVVETDGIHHQRVAFPFTNRVTQPTGIWVLGKLAAVGEDLAIEVECLIKDDDQSRSLENLERHRSGVYLGYALRQAMRVGLFQRPLSV